MSDLARGIPMFPLQTVLVPGGYLPLKIFEPRYLDLVRDCVRDSSGFGVCLILSGSDTGRAPEHTKVGTMAVIRDWNSLDGGLLGITTQGERRFRISKTVFRDNGLMVADVEWIAEAKPAEIPVSLSVLPEIVARFMEKLGHNYPDFDKQKLEDAAWVGYRLTELLPIRNLERQGLLELEDPVGRLERLLKILPRFQ